MTKETLRYAHPTGLALGITAGILYSVCAFFVALWPAQAVKFFSYWFHGIDIAQIYDPTKLTWMAFFKGLVSILVAAYLIGVLYGMLYNKCVDHCKKKGWI